jgi:multidrug efflux pump subunit AcrA (membrane-fusion protein)
MKKLTLTLALFTILLTACAGTSTPTPTESPLAPAETQPNLVTAEGTLRPASSIELAFAQGGLVAEVLAQPGEKVATGDVLARLVGIETVQAELAAGQLAQTQAEQALDQLKRNALLTAAQSEQALLAAQSLYENESDGWDIDNLESASDLELGLEDYILTEQDYREARDKLTDLLGKDESNRERRSAQTDFDREAQSLSETYADLLQDTAANEHPLTEKQANLLAAIAALEAARENHSRLDSQNTDSEVLTLAEARLAAATAHVTAAQSALAFYELRAPFAGTILHLDLKPGQAAQPGLPVAWLADTSRWVVETKDLAEIDIARVAIGQNATVKLDAFPNEEFPATVTAINPIGQEYLGDRTYQVTLTLNQPDPRFLWQMTATVSITTE